MDGSVFPLYTAQWKREDAGIRLPGCESWNYALLQLCNFEQVANSLSSSVCLSEKWG